VFESSENGIRGDEFIDLEKQEAEDGKEELPGISSDQDHSKLGIMPISNNEPPRNSPSCTVELENQHFEIQNLAD